MQSWNVDIDVQETTASKLKIENRRMKGVRREQSQTPTLKSDGNSMAKTPTIVS